MDCIEQRPAPSRGRWRVRAALVSAAVLALSLPLGGGALAADHKVHAGGFHDADHDVHGAGLRDADHDFRGGGDHDFAGDHDFHGGFAFRGGDDRDDFDRNDFGWGGFGWWNPDYGDGFDWDHPYYSVTPGYAYGAPAANVWYYCRNPAGYYPYVQQCYGPWQTVPAG